MTGVSRGDNLSACHRKFREKKREEEKQCFDAEPEPEADTSEWNGSCKWEWQDGQRSKADGSGMTPLLLTCIWTK